MDAKDLRTEAALGDRSNDGNTKYVHGGGALPCHRNKTYQDIGSNSLAKVDTPAARPCAVIGPDRVVPPAPTDVYYKKGPPEPWQTPENTYRRPPDYPHKLLDYQHPSRNISPRQTFQENMQRIMVPPSYNAAKLKEDHFPGESNIPQMRSNKLSVASESNSKYCDVPYSVNSMINDQKNVRNSDISVSNMNTVLARGVPHGWPPTSSNIQPSKPAHQELCQYPEYQSCPAPRPMVMTRPLRTVHEEPGPVYPDSYYHNGNIRFKPYQVKERFPHSRYEYIGNYSNPFHPPPPFPTHKYDLQKPLPPHPYSSYSQVPLKYLESRMADPIMNGYQRSLNQQAYSSIPFRNQVMHPSYGPVPGNCLPTNKYYPYPLDGAKTMPSNKLPYDMNSKLYTDYESNRSKNYPASDAFYINEIARPLPTKGPVLPPNYPTNIHAMPTHPYYRKESLKGYEYNPHFRNIDHMLGVNGNIMPRFPSQFSPSAIAISPSDSNTSNDTNQTHGTSQEDCGYVSQSSTASARSMDSVINRMPLDAYRRYDHRYGNNMKGSASFAKLEQSTSTKEKKDIDVRQFLQMWNEGEDEGGESNNKETNIKAVSNNSSNNINAANYGTTNQEQLYVLGLVNVPSEELEKYQHIQKVSKLPENIKGYSSIELLHQFEEVIESSNLNHYNDKSPATKVYHNSYKSNIPMHGMGIPSRPLSPLDVEAKISQSVIHKEVGCNFEIKPCSPKMLNVEVATPVQTVNGERMIEKVSNPLINQPPIRHNMTESRDDCNVMKSQGRLSMQDNTKIASCKMINTPYGNKDPVDPVKTNYSIQDLESNSGVCLASLPRLDNDIELNFPEVNQQFINANKMESVITSGPMKDLPPLDVDQTEPINRDQEIDILNCSSKRNLEKDFSKLSKYRKLKRKSPSPNTPASNVQALRTDSVIIKNPENCKSETMEKCLSSETISREAQNDPINLSVNTENCINTNTLHFSYNSGAGVQALHDRPNDFAIDFSINANVACNFTRKNKVNEIIPTENHVNFKRSNVTWNDKKDLLHAHEHNAFNEGSSDGNEKQICQPHGNENDCNTTSVPNESLHCIAKNVLDNSIESSKTQSQDNTQNKIELNVPLTDTSFSQLQKYNVTDKEALNRKLSAHNLLSSQGNENDCNTTSVPNESLHCIAKNVLDNSIESCKTQSQDNIQNKIELNVPLTDTSFSQSQKYNVTDKEALNRKLSAYNLLSSQEKEDTLNEKMRELFGEEFSHADTETDYEHVEDTQAILNDESVEVTKKDNVFSDESSQSSNEEVVKKSASPNGEHCRKEMETTTREQNLSEKRNEILDLAHNNILPAQNMHENRISQNKDAVSDVAVTGKVINNLLPSVDITDSCVNIFCAGYKKYSKTNHSLINKELLSPWIQKLIVYNEGCTTVSFANMLENRNYQISGKIHTDVRSENSSTAKDKNCKMPTNYTCTAVIKMNDHLNIEKPKNINYSNVLVTSTGYESSTKNENNVEMEIGSFDKVMTAEVKKGCERLESDMSAILKVNGNKIDKNNCNMESNACTNNIIKRSHEKPVSDSKDKKSDIISKYDCNLESDTCAVNVTTKSYEKPASDSTKVLDNTNNRGTVEKMKICDQLKSDTNIEGLKADNDQDCGKLANDSANHLEIFNDHKTVETPIHNDELKSITCSTVSEEGNDESSNIKTDEKNYDEQEIDMYIKEELTIDTTKDLNVIVDHERGQDMKNYIRSENDIHAKVLKTNQNLENRNKFESDTSGFETPIEHKTDENSKTSSKLVSNTNTNVLEIENMQNRLESCEMLEYANATLTKACNEHNTENISESEKLRSRTCAKVSEDKVENDIVLKTVDVNETVESLVNPERVESETRKIIETTNDVICDIQKSVPYNEALEMLNVFGNGKKVKAYKELSDLGKINEIDENGADLISVINRKVDLEENEEILSSDEKLGENWKPNSNHLCNKTQEYNEVTTFSKSSSLTTNIDQSCINKKHAVTSSLTDTLEKDVGSLETIIDDSPIINREPLNVCTISKRTETVPVLLSSTEKDKESFLAENFTLKTVLEDLKTTSKDNTSINEGSNHIVLGSISKADSKSNETSPEHLVENYFKVSQIDIYKPTSEEHLFSIDSDINDHNQIDTSLKGKYGNSISDESDETSTSDDENTSDSTDSNRFSNDEGITNAFDFENQDTVCTEQSQLQSSTDVQSNDLIFTNPIGNVDVMNNDSKEKLVKENQVIQIEVANMGKKSNGEKDEIDSLKSDSISVLLEDLNPTNDVAQNIMENSGFVLEASCEETKYAIIENLVPNEKPLTDSGTKERYSTTYLNKRRKSLKRSLSDSALDDIRDNFNEEPPEKSPLLWPNKRKKDVAINNYRASQLIAENICHVLQNRRNSISAIHNEGNVSFCILIDNDCIISEECDETDKICFSELPDDSLSCIQEEPLGQEDSTAEIMSSQEGNTCEYSDHIHFPEDDKLIHEPWVEDIACVETVLSDDIAENIVISASGSPKDDEDNDEEREMYNVNEHTEKLKFIYGDKIYGDDAHFVDTLYRTPQMNVNKTLSNRESHNTDDSSGYYDKESLERVLSESNFQEETTDSVAFCCRTPLPSPAISELSFNENDRVRSDIRDTDQSNTPLYESKEYDLDNENCKKYEYLNKETKENIINSYESSIDDIFDYKKDEESLKCAISSSPEVSSTTSEEKNSGILLKITKYGGSRVSQINDIKPVHSISCKYTEKKDYLSSNGNLPTRTLITKAAQKYIPPLKETIHDLKVKLSLPQQSLVKLRHLKLAKEMLKPNIDRPANMLRKEVPKKVKPLFEDVLKSIDELQYQKHKEKNKKGRKSIPKVVIKKNEHGSHYASSCSKHQFNPDLTGRKWQPWVFLEKDRFIDKMAVKKNTRAIFNHRKNSYVLAEKFRKYKSICNTKFIISQPKRNDSTSGQLKYTIRLKHN